MWLIKLYISPIYINSKTYILVLLSSEFGLCNEALLLRIYFKPVLYWIVNLACELPKNTILPSWGNLTFLTPAINESFTKAPLLS